MGLVSIRNARIGDHLNTFAKRERESGSEQPTKCPGLCPRHSTACLHPAALPAPHPPLPTARPPAYLDGLKVEQRVDGAVIGVVVRLDRLPADPPTHPRPPTPTHARAHTHAHRPPARVLPCTQGGSAPSESAIHARGPGTGGACVRGAVRGYVRRCGRREGPRWTTRRGRAEGTGARAPEARAEPRCSRRMSGVSTSDRWFVRLEGWGAKGGARASWPGLGGGPC